MKLHLNPLNPELCVSFINMLNKFVGVSLAESVSPYICHKQNKSNSISYKDDVIEKGETDSFRRESVLFASEDEEKSNYSAPKEKRFKQDYRVNSNPNQKSIYTKTTEDKDKGVKIVTSVSVSDLEDSSPNITFQQLHEALSENPSHCSTTPVTNIVKINCSGSQVKLEIQEILQLNASDVKTTFVFTNEKGGGAETAVESKGGGAWTPDNESYEQLQQNVTNHSADKNYRFTFGSTSDQISDSNSKIWDDPNYCRCCAGHRQQVPTDCTWANRPSSPPLLLNLRPQEERKHLHKRFSIDQFWDIPPPQEFADGKYNTLEDLSLDLASCRIGTCSPFDEESGFPYSAKDLAPSFDQLSESDNYEPMFMRPSLSTNRSSFTKEFISSQKRKSWIRNNSIATVEHRACPSAQKRRQTFPGMSEDLGLMQEDLLLPYGESFSSLTMCSCPLQAERLGRCHHGDDKFPALDTPDSEIPSDQPSLLSSSRKTSTEDHPDDTFAVCTQRPGGSSVSYRRKGLRHLDKDFKQSICKDVDSPDTDDCDCKVDLSEVADSGFDQDMGEVEYLSPEPPTEELSQRALAIQVIPPSCSGSEEEMLPSNLVMPIQEDPISSLPKRKSSVMTLTVGGLEQRFLQVDRRSSQGSRVEKPLTSTLDDSCVSAFQHIDVQSLNSNEVTESESKPPGEETGNSSLPLTTEQTNDLQPPVAASCPEICVKEQHLESNKAHKQIVSRCSFEAKEHLKPVMHKEAESGGGGVSDHWARRRKLFKDSQQWSSAGGSSITSDVAEESVSEETRSMDMTIRDNEDGGFYTETFHSSAWIYQGDHVDSGVAPPTLNARTRAVSIRERTVRINKGAGEFPWGFRIQFSKPIVVTEVDTNGAAEEAGLMVGDFVLAVNGTDVTSIPHSEAAELARQGPDDLTLTIGSDIARGPNTPRPACRGYLHKRTQSGLIKGWRKRWFVLTHDCCLHYYRHKRDEGKRRDESAVKLEGAEVGPDVSLGKPFAFKCRPPSGSRVFFFCATSNQEMKRWLDAMERATHPVTQSHVWVDVTRHNSSLPPLAVKSPECLGLLHKLDKSKDAWLQHYCILKDGCLYLYSGIRATRAHGAIYLQGYSVREQTHGFRKSTIELKPPSEEFKTFYFCAENPNENKRWIGALRASVQKWLPLHQALQELMNRPAEETRM
ncbi:uncharacterized protein pdzph1 isoform X1 [Scophthalmus maximus]|nr:uncharacterized protein pdzph1 isoform X1 [Scophthalmus maximus]